MPADGFRQDCADCPMREAMDVSAAGLTLAINRKLLELVTTKDMVLERLSQVEDYIHALRYEYGEMEAAK